ncbi:MAG: glycoside hydrolase family 3 N-terminal domain-containing protein [Solirubrobacteraceae bacterium]
MVATACAAMAGMLALMPSSTARGAARGDTQRAALAGGGGAPVGARVKAPALSPLQLAGERVIYSYRGLTPPRQLIQAIRAGEAAGVIFFSDNISSRAQIRRVIAGLQRDAMRSPVKLPLLMMTDQEGGQVRRLPGAPDESEKQIGSGRGAAAAASRAGRGAGLNLRAAGMNVNLAPVLDVYRRAGNFIDEFGRSYSSNPHTVATLGSDFIRAQQATGVAATAKHFPGLGAAATDQNTDLGPVTLRLSLRAVRSIDQLPYTAAISAGVRMVMVSWARYPALDPGRPAGLSATIVQGELRRRLGFRGVTITDALGAGALRGYGSTANRAMLAARAGMDLILCASQSPGEGAAAVGALARALARGQLGRPGFRSAVSRVMSLRSEP